MPGPESRDEEWAADRAQEAKPLPYSDLRHYSNEGQRQADLSAAEEKNIATAAGELGLTSTEWKDLRKQLGRSPGRGDVKK